MQCGKANLFWVCFDGSMRFVEFFSWLDDCFLFEFFGLTLRVCGLLCCSFLSFMKLRNFGQKILSLVFSPVAAWLYRFRCVGMAWYS